MAEIFSFFDSVNGDRTYPADGFAEYFRRFLSTGVYHQNNIPSLGINKGQLLQSILEPGSAFLEGYMYKNTEEISFYHDQADTTNPRIDRIVIRLDKSVQNRFVRAFLKKGSPATNPLPPVLTRNINIYEISLAQIRINAGSGVITTVTDERLNPDVCGIVSSLISIPTDRFEAEWQTWFSTIQGRSGTQIITSVTAPSDLVANDLWFKEV